MCAKARVTRDDVAELAGVAPSTVSNVINNKGNVSDELRERVLSAIRELNYTPNLVARSLMTKSSKHIGLIIDEITNPHFAELAKGAQYEAEKNGYILSISLTTGNVDRIVEDYLVRHIDGIIFDAYANSLSDSIGSKVRESGISYVSCNSPVDYATVFLDIDYFGGMKEAYYYLMELGHKKIAYICGLRSKDARSNYYDARVEAFKWCFEQFGEDLDENYIIYGRPPYYTDYDRGYEYAKELLERDLGVTAVIVVNDYTALGVLQAFKEQGIRVPEDMSVISFDNTVYAKSSTPPLTSLASPVFEIGQEAVRYIIQQQNGTNKRIARRFPMKLVVRDSTAGPK